MWTENEFIKQTQIERERWVFLPDLFNWYSKPILNKLGVLSRFIIGWRNLNNISQADNTIIISDLEGKLKVVLDNIVKESRKKGLLQEEKCMIASKKKNKKKTVRSVIYVLGMWKSSKY